MSRCMICDFSPGNESLFRLSVTRPEIRFREDLQGWICSECFETEDTLDVADIFLAEEDLDAPPVPPEMPLRPVK